MSWTRLERPVCGLCSKDAVYKRTDGFELRCESCMEPSKDPRRPKRCPRCHGQGNYDSGYNGWFAAPDTKCDVCNGEGFV